MAKREGMVKGVAAEERAGLVMFYSANDREGGAIINQV